jgi:hypothetical protein
LDAVLSREGDEAELRVLIVFADGTAILTEELSW